METKVRVLTLIGIGRIFEDTLKRKVFLEKDGLTPSCISCESFNEQQETCGAANDTRPPARVIAFGCNMYRDKDDIPF